MAAVKSWHDAVEWLDLISTPAGSWPTIVRDSDTQLTINGTDFTTEMAAGRRIRVVGATTEEGFITSSTFTGGNTEVVVAYDDLGTSTNETTPTSPTQVWVGPASVGKAAWYDTGTGNGLDADTVDGQHAAALGSNTGKNRVINGRMNVWQRGTSFTDPSDAYTADRFMSSVGGSGAGTISRQSFTAGQTDVPNEPTYFFRHNQTSNGTNPYVLQRIEDVRTFAGQAIIWSFYAKAGGSENITAEINQNFGSGGSTEVQVTTSAETLTTSWVRYTVTATLDSISGKTIGADNYLELKIELPSGSSFTIDLADWQIELGSSATDIDQVPSHMELLACQRYYLKTFDLDVAPAQATGDPHGSIFHESLGVDHRQGWYFPTRMRDIPTITTYNPVSSNANWRNYSAGTDTTVAVIDVSETNVELQAAPTTDGDRLRIHLAADAEL